MPNIKILHLKKSGTEELNVTAYPGDNLGKVIFYSGIDMVHRCGFHGMCGGCRVRVTQGMESLAAPSQDEADQIMLAGCDHSHRISCMVKVGESDLTIEVPERIYG